MWRLVLAALAAVLVTQAVASGTGPPLGSLDFDEEAVEFLEVASEAEPSVEPEGGKPLSAAEKMAGIKCELAVASLGSKLLKADDKLAAAKADHSNAAQENKLAQEEYDNMERTGSREESISFGKQYLNLRKQFAKLQERDKRDNVYKLKFVSLHDRISPLTQNLTATTKQKSLLDEEIARLKQEKKSLTHQLKLTTEKIKAFGSDLDTSQEVLDNKFAEKMIKAKTEDANLRLELSESKKKSLEMEKTMGPLMAALKPIAEELSQTQHRKSDYKVQLKKLQMEIIKLARETKESVGTLQAKASLASKRLKDQVLSAAQKREAEREKEEQTEQKVEPRIAAEKVLAEAKGEAKIEEAEVESSTEGSVQQETAQELQESLERELTELKARTEKRLDTETERAARELERVKEGYRQALIKEQKADGTYVPPADQPDKFAKDKKQVEKLVAELRAAAPKEEDDELLDNP